MVMLKAELQKAQREERGYAAMRQNVEDFLSPAAVGAGAEKEYGTEINPFSAFYPKLLSGHQI